MLVAVELDVLVELDGVLCGLLVAVELGVLIELDELLCGLLTVVVLYGLLVELGGVL